VAQPRPFKRVAGGVNGAAMELIPRDAAREAWCRSVLDVLRAAVYTTDAAGRITYFNQEAVDLAGRRPELGKDEWCITWRLYWPDGTPMPHDKCPMAVAPKEKSAIRGAEAILERPDGTRVAFAPYPTPLQAGLSARSTCSWTSPIGGPPKAPAPISPPSSTRPMTLSSGRMRSDRWAMNSFIQRKGHEPDRR
jgi:PAS domain-containing protein